MNFRRKSNDEGLLKIDRAVLDQVHGLIARILGRSQDLTLQTCQEALQQYQGLAANWEQQRADLKLAKKELRTAKLQNERSESTASDRIKIETAQTRRQISGLEAEMAKQATENRELEKQIKALQQTNQKQEERYKTAIEIQKLEVAIRTKERNHKARQLKELIQKTSASSNDSATTIKRLEARIRAEEEKNKLANSKMSSLELKLATLKKGVPLVDEPTSQQQTELVETKAKLNDALRRVSTLEQEKGVALAESHRELEQAKAEIAELQVEKSKTDKSENSNQLKTKLEETTTTLRQAERRISVLEEEEAEELQEVEEKLQKSEARVASLTKQLANKQSAHEKKKSQALTGAQRELENVSNEEELRAKLEETKNKLRQAERRISVLEEEEAEELEEVEEKLSKSEAKVALLTKRLNEKESTAKRTKPEESTVEPTGKDRVQSGALTTKGDTKNDNRDTSSQIEYPGSFFEIKSFDYSTTNEKSDSDCTPWDENSRVSTKKNADAPNKEQGDSSESSDTDSDDSDSEDGNRAANMHIKQASHNDNHSTKAKDKPGNFSDSDDSDSDSEEGVAIVESKTARGDPITKSRHQEKAEPDSSSSEDSDDSEESDKMVEIKADWTGQPKPVKSIPDYLIHANSEDNETLRLVEDKKSQQMNSWMSETAKIIESARSRSKKMDSSDDANEGVKLPGQTKQLRDKSEAAASLKDFMATNMDPNVSEREQSETESDAHEVILPFISPKKRRNSDSGSFSSTESKISLLSSQLTDTQHHLVNYKGKIRALEQKVARVEETEAMVSKSFSMIAEIQKELKALRASAKEDGGLAGDFGMDSKEFEAMKQRLERAEDDSERMEGIVADLQKQLSALIVRTYKFMQGNDAQQQGKTTIKQGRKQLSRFPYH